LIWSRSLGFLGAIAAAAGAREATKFLPMKNLFQSTRSKTVELGS